MGNKKKSEKYSEEKNLLEYIVFYTSLTLVVGLLFYLSYATITVDDTKPILTAEYTNEPQPNAPFQYKVYVKNSSNSTAQDVIIELVQESDGEFLEKGQLKVKYVTGNSTVDGWINFTKNPAEADTIYARIVSYKGS